ncbi:MAG: ATP-binding protein [Bacteroidota bacterium]
MIQRLWKKLANLGCHDAPNEKERIKINILNKLIFMLTVLATVIATLYYVLSNNYKVVLIYSISIFFGIISFILQHYRLRNFVRHSCCFAYPVWLAIAICLVKDSSAGESSVFLLIAMVAFIQYEGQLAYKISCIGLNILLAVVSLTYIGNFAPVYLNTYGFSVLLVGLIISVSFIFQFYQNDIQSIVDQKDDLVQQLQLKNAELERFAYITSHDLKEPVKNIEGFSKLLKRILTKDSTAENAQMATMIHNSSKRMSTLIESILKYSKLEKDHLNMEMIDLNVILQEFKVAHTLMLEDKKAVIQYGDLPKVKGNKIYLSLLFQNLLENAIKYNESTTPSVKIFAHQRGNNVHLIISDNGIGINEEYTNYIFEPFRRLHNRSKYEGTGLGLAICKKIVENHAGKIWVESAGQGSQFNILLPSAVPAFHLN